MATTLRKGINKPRLFFAIETNSKSQEYLSLHLFHNFYFSIKLWDCLSVLNNEKIRNVINFFLFLNVFELLTLSNRLKFYNCESRGINQKIYLISIYRERKRWKRVKRRRNKCVFLPITPSPRDGSARRNRRIKAKFLFTFA